MSSCTAMLVGKNATIDGSTIIARDEDAEDGVNPKTFKVFPAKDYTGERYVSKYNGLTVEMKGQGCRYTATPNGVLDEGRWDEQGINEYNVAMSATETEMTNARVLGHDPLVENGINEDSMVYLVLPFIKSAREGVQRLGSLIEKYGTGESNGLPNGFLMMLMQLHQILCVSKRSTLTITIASCMRRKLKILLKNII